MRVLASAGFIIAVVGAWQLPPTIEAQAPATARSATIRCEPGQIYRDERDAFRRGAEYCGRALGGLLWVNDGPFKFWNGDDTVSEGSHRAGRQVGVWKECNRFGRCSTTDRGAEWAAGRQRPGTRPEVPVSFRDGKYLFDFASCWGTWVDVEDPTRGWNLNISGSEERCVISIFPDDGRWDKPEGATCRVPFQIGVREVSTIELWREIPQFCEPEPILIDGRLEHPTWFRVLAYERREKDGKPFFAQQGWVAWSPDVTCAAIESPARGRPHLTVRLNEYAEPAMATHLAAGHVLRTQMCGFGEAGFELDTVTMTGPEGRRLFSYPLSANARTAARQRGCIAQRATLQPSCSAP
jgi:hypothetical protein